MDTENNIPGSSTEGLADSSRSGQRDTTVDLNTNDLTITIRHPTLPPRIKERKRDDETLTVTLSGNLTIDIE